MGFPSVVNSYMNVLKMILSISAILRASWKTCWNLYSVLFTDLLHAPETNTQIIWTMHNVYSEIYILNYFLEFLASKTHVICWESLKVNQIYSKLLSTCKLVEHLSSASNSDLLCLLKNQKRKCFSVLQKSVGISDLIKTSDQSLLKNTSVYYFTIVGNPEGNDSEENVEAPEVDQVITSEAADDENESIEQSKWQANIQDESMPVAEDIITLSESDDMTAEFNDSKSNAGIPRKEIKRKPGESTEQIDSKRPKQYLPDAGETPSTDQTEKETEGALRQRNMHSKFRSDMNPFDEGLGSRIDLQHFLKQRLTKVMDVINRDELLLKPIESPENSGEENRTRPLDVAIPDPWLQGKTEFLLGCFPSPGEEVEMVAPLPPSEEKKEQKFIHQNSPERKETPKKIREEMSEQRPCRDPSYRPYPGLAENPATVKKDARYQKKFYKKSKDPKYSAGPSSESCAIGSSETGRQNRQSLSTSEISSIEGQNTDENFVNPETRVRYILTKSDASPQKSASESSKMTLVGRRRMYLKNGKVKIAKFYTRVKADVHFYNEENCCEMKNNRIIFCRDALAAQTGNKVYLLPLFLVVFSDSTATPEISMEEFLADLRKYQETYYSQKYFDETTVNESIFSITIPIVPLVDDDLRIRIVREGDDDNGDDTDKFSSSKKQPDSESRSTNPPQSEKGEFSGEAKQDHEGKRSGSDKDTGEKDLPDGEIAPEEVHNIFNSESEISLYESKVCSEVVKNQKEMENNIEVMNESFGHLNTAEEWCCKIFCVNELDTHVIECDKNGLDKGMTSHGSENKQRFSSKALDSKISTNRKQFLGEHSLNDSRDKDDESNPKSSQVDLWPAFVRTQQSVANGKDTRAKAPFVIKLPQNELHERKAENFSSAIHTAEVAEIPGEASLSRLPNFGFPLNERQDGNSSSAIHATEVAEISEGEDSLSRVPNYGFTFDERPAANFVRGTYYLNELESNSREEAGSIDNLSNGNLSFLCQAKKTRYSDRSM